MPNILVPNIFVRWTIARYWVPKPTPLDGINFVTLIDSFVSETSSFRQRYFRFPGPKELGDICVKYICAKFIFDFQVLRSLESTF